MSGLYVHFLGENSLQTDRQIETPREAKPLQLLAVIVLYKMTPSESVSFQTLQMARRDVEKNKLHLKVFFYDNTPGGQDPGFLPEGVQYEAAPQNRGLADAYNRALEIAKAEGFDWLLTLDQDSTLPSNFLSGLSEAVAGVAEDPSVAAVVPQITGAGRMLSPNYFLFNALPRFFPKGFIGISLRETYAFNSASTLRVSALHEIGGYDPHFWLDNSDAYMYRQLHLHGHRVFVAGNIQVEHQFSMFDMKESVTVARYQNIVAAGCAFWDLELGTLAGLYHTASLVYRVYKHWKRGDDPEIRRITLRLLKARIFKSRKQRIAQWKTAVENRLRDAPSQTHSEEGVRSSTKISVCMAAYNGGQFIAEQILSILPQLNQADELIVVDDASTDNTAEIIASFHDSRIRLFRNATNLGLFKTFERALGEAKGEIIFLSDQDDIWHPQKISTVLQAFRAHPEAAIVVSDATLIDQHGQTLAGSYYQQRGEFSDGFLSNLFRCKFLGCVMAFRAKVLRSALPFPRSAWILHDIWIGTVNRLSGGKTHYIPDPLVFYRRHRMTATGARRLPLGEQIQWRWHLLWAAAKLRLHGQF
jgi:glycosyltransferase involved in cell wall biosynthesis